MQKSTLVGIVIAGVIFAVFVAVFIFYSSGAHSGWDSKFQDGFEQEQDAFETVNDAMKTYAAQYTTSHIELTAAGEIKIDGAVKATLTDKQKTALSSIQTAVSEQYLSSVRYANGRIEYRYENDLYRIVYTTDGKKPAYMRESGEDVKFKRIHLSGNWYYFRQK